MPQTAPKKHSTDLSSLFQRLQRQTGLSNRALAERLHASEAMVSYINSGKRRPSLELLTKIADLSGNVVSVSVRPKA